MVHRVVESSGSHPLWLIPLLLYHLLLAGLTGLRVGVELGTGGGQAVNFLAQLHLLLGVVAGVQGIFLGVAILRGKRKRGEEDEIEVK